MRQKALAVLISFVIASIGAGLIIIPPLIQKSLSPQIEEKASLNSPPSEIGGMRLSRFVDGEEALAGINKLHGRKIFLKNGIIANYGGDKETAMLWIADTGSPSKAKALLNRMVRKIKGRGKVFQYLRAFRRKGVLVHELAGMNQSHYIYRQTDKVIWISVSSARPKKALEDTLRNVE